MQVNNNNDDNLIGYFKSLFLELEAALLLFSLFCVERIEFYIVF